MPQAFVTLFCEAIKAVLRTLSGVRFCSPGKRSATGGRYTPHSKKTRTFRDGVLFKRKNKKPGLSTGLSALFDAWQFPTLTWGDPTLLSHDQTLQFKFDAQRIKLRNELRVHS
ncbi:hypothetical protein [Klebsiella pneumoniae]|uniref:hypothetical protein n=1 Tax=Klebsiella pneumoniae TaxID=573 RepID=UPI0013966B0A|nr:hypothetical protein [Klebsiella pneumoniae]